MELAPDYDYAFLNRQDRIVLRTAGQAGGRRDLSEFYRRRPGILYVLWLYMAEHEVNKEQADKALLRRFKQHSGDEWG